MWDKLPGRRRPDPAVGPAGRPELVVVTRAGCHLCEEMLATVRAEAGPRAEVGTLDLDAALAAGELTQGQHHRWTSLVPVLLADGDEVAHHRVAPGELTALLRRGPARRRGRTRRFGGSGGTTIE